MKTADPLLFSPGMLNHARPLAPPAKTPGLRCPRIPTTKNGVPGVTHDWFEREWGRRDGWGGYLVLL